MAKLTVVLVLLLSQGICFAQTNTFCPMNFDCSSYGLFYGPLADKNGQVFNIKAYGAKGDGTTDDTAAYNAAVAAAQANGGKIYFPNGTYELNNPNQLNPLLSPATVSIECESPRSTIIQFTGSQGITLSNGNIYSPYSSGFVKNCTFDLTKASAGAIGLHLIDSVSWYISNNAFETNSATATIGIELEDHIQWCERNHIMNNQFFGLNPSIEFVWDTGNPYNPGSWGYNFIFGDQFQVPNTASAILLNGTATLYSNTWDITANFTGPTGYIINATNGAQARYNNIWVEGEGGGSTYLLCADSTSNFNFSGKAYAFGTGNDQEFTCPASAGLGNIINTYESSNATNLTMPQSKWPNAPGILNQFVDTESIDSSSGSGHVIGANLGAPYVWVYGNGYPGNAFTVFSADFPANPNNLTAREWFDNTGNGNFTGGISIGDTTTAKGPQWTSGTTAPTGACTNGSLYSNSSGASGSTLYGCVANAWVDIK